MPNSKYLKVTDLKLDLHNFRTVPQKSESKFLHAVTTISPEPFWALVNSLIEDGYVPIESILVLERSPGVFLVKEGNRRVAALKWIFGTIKPTNFNVPVDITDKVSEVTDEWKESNKEVPCTIFSLAESDLVERIVSRTHGKAELAGRDPWFSVAKARHNRDINRASEPSLDLLEKYLLHGSTGTTSQKELWAGDYPISILEEALKILSPRVGKTSSRELANSYPKLPHIAAIDELLRDIGLELVKFRHLRGEDILNTNYGIPPLVSPNTKSTNTNSGGAGGGTEKNCGTSTQLKGKPKTGKPVALPLTDPRAVMRALRTLVPHGKNREKVATLLNEARCLSLGDNPHAFCFLLRSIFEISAKAYCKDHSSAGLKSSDANGNDRNLVDILRDITKHLTNNGSDKAKTKHLHGALAELAKPTGLLSVTSMNQLVHHPKFSVTSDAICSLFFNVFPLLEELNA